MVTHLKLVGGLGNQMFIYVAGMYLKVLLGHDVKFVDGSLSLVGGNVSHPNSSLNQLTWGEDLLRNSGASSLEATVLDVLAGIESRIFGPNPVLRCSPKTYTSRVTGYDPEILNLKKGTYIRGYFQTYKFFHELSHFDPPPMPQVIDPGGEFVEARRHFRESRPLIVHLRRGDYTAHSSLGILDFSYYRKAIEILQERNLTEGREVWIFSDSKVEAHKLADFLSINATPVSSRFNLGVAEELLLMTEGSAHVLSNSTFSWWGSKLSSSSELTICPTDWFRAAPSPEFLLPEEWIKAPSQWA